MILILELPEDFFTTASLATLAGCTGIVYVICSGVQRACNYNPKWLALVVSLVVSLVAAYLTEEPALEKGAHGKYIIAFFNGFLIYASSAGTNQVLSSRNHDEAPAGNGTPADPAHHRQAVKPRQKRTFFTSWF